MFTESAYTFRQGEGLAMTVLESSSSQKRLRVLLIEDNHSDTELIVRRLNHEGLLFDWLQIENETDFINALDAGCDLILSDWILPDFSGLLALKITRERDLDIPFIIISGSIGAEAATEALHRGASDYLLKDRPERLGLAVRNALAQKEMKAAHIQTENLLRLQSAALNAAANTMVITRPDGIIEWVNPAFANLTGYSFAETVGKNPSQLIKSGYHSKLFYKELWETILAGKVWRGEMVNRRKDGQIYYEETTITPVVDALGQICQFIAVKEDITSRKAAEGKLQKSEERFREVAQNAGEWIWEVDREGLYLYTSPVVEKILGFTPDELVGRVHFFELFPPNVREGLKALTFKKMANKENIHGAINIYQTQDGREVILESNGVPILDDHGELLGYRGTDLDITERKQAEQALQNSQERFRQLVELSPDAIFVDRGGRIDFVNPAALRLFGATSPEQILGKTSFQVFHPAHHAALAKRMRRILEQHKTFTLIEEQIICLDGRTRDVEVTAAPFSDSCGDAVQVILRDITERKLSEALLQRASEELTLAYDATLQGWSNALELREHETAGHSQRVVRLALGLAAALGVAPDEFIHIQRGALLHDIGKMGIPDSILLKPGPLNPEEWEIMRKHPVYAYDLLSKIPFLSAALDIPHYHHERWDGTGYPEKLAGEAIPLPARIFAVVDIWDALRFDRPYRKAWPAEKVLAYIKELSGNHLDPAVVEAFVKLNDREE